MCYNGNIENKGNGTIMKFWKKFGVLAMGAAVLCLSLLGTGCGDKPVICKEVVKCKSQLDALTQLKAGTVDAAIIDSVMAKHYVAQSEYSTLQIIDGLILKEEEYGIAGRKEDKAFLSEINKALIAIANSDYQTIATKYHLQDDRTLTAATTDPLAGATDDSWEEIKTSGKIIIGYTVFAPIAWPDGDVLTGFDVELARAVVAYLNEQYSLSLTLDFQEISWDSKEALLSAGTVDLIWNGLTITDERKAEMCISVPYLKNNQVAVISKEDKDVYTDEASLKETVIGVEGGSAGEDVVYGK